MSWLYKMFERLRFQRQSRSIRKAMRACARLALDAKSSPTDQAFIFLSQDYPPGLIGGVGRYIHQLAVAIAAEGHCVHVVTKSKADDVLSLENGVWTHRIPIRPHAPPAGLKVPEHIWSYSQSMLERVRCIARTQIVKCVYAPIWDCEGLAILEDGQFPLVVGLQTTMRFWMALYPEKIADTQFWTNFLKPMLALEERLLMRAPGLHAISTAIARDIEATYYLKLDWSRIRVAPLAQEDWALSPDQNPRFAPGTLNILFVGRLEKRKGVDVLLKIAPDLLRRHPNLHIHFVGSEAAPEPGAASYRETFEATASRDDLLRTHFHGAVNDMQLRGFYRHCDIFVSPSRFESFGLIFVEAMIYGKPVVGCEIGGMPEVIADNVTGLLAKPGDAKSLYECLERLIQDPALRLAMGEAGRRRYESMYSPKPLARAIASFMDQTSAAHAAQSHSG